MSVPASSYDSYLMPSCLEYQYGTYTPVVRVYQKAVRIEVTRSCTIVIKKASNVESRCGFNFRELICLSLSSKLMYQECVQGLVDMICKKYIHKS